MKRAFAFGDKSIEAVVRRINDIKSVALIGAGTMGQGIAVDLLAKTDYTIILLDVDAEIDFDERELGKESLDYPFAIIEFEVDRFGRGEGSLHVAAAVSIDEYGHLEVEDYDGADGKITRIKQIR